MLSIVSNNHANVLGSQIVWDNVSLMKQTHYFALNRICVTSRLLQRMCLRSISMYVCDGDPRVITALEYYRCIGSTLQLHVDYGLIHPL